MPAANRSGVAHLPRKKIPPDLRSLARGHTALCIKVLAGSLAKRPCHRPRVSAAGILLDCGSGCAQQPHTGEDCGNIRIVVLRQITEETDAAGVGPSSMTAKLAS